MKKLLFISNISDKITNFAIPSISAAHNMGIEFYHASNWTSAAQGQIEYDSQKYGIKIYNVPISRSPFSISNIKAYKEVCGIIKKEKIDFIHCNTPVGGMIGRIAGKKYKVKKIIYTAHGFHFYKGAPLINRTVFKCIEMLMAHWTDAIITMNKEDYEAAKKFRLNRNSKNIYFTHGVGIDIDDYKDINVDKNQLKSKLGLKETDIICISMGDLIKRKNYKTAIDAVSRCANNVHYLICGKGSELEELKKFAVDKGVKDRVHFLGYRSDIKELLAISDIFLFTTLQEGLPRSMMEAMASGLPCVVSNIRGNVDLIENGGGGFLCSPDSPTEFAKAIEKCTASIRKELGESNLKAINMYSVSNVKKEMQEIYNKVLGGRI